jgi:anti-anti-sigma regulatory factor
MFYRIERLGSLSAHPSEKAIQAPLKAVIIDTKNIASMDASAVQIMKEMVDDYTRRGIEVCFVKLNDRNKKFLLLADVLQK